MRITRKQLGILYRAAKDGKLTISKEQMSWLYSYEGYESNWPTKEAEHIRYAVDSAAKHDWELAQSGLKHAFSEAGAEIGARAKVGKDALLAAIRAGIVTVEKKDGSVVFGGATFDHKEAIKAHGAKWDAASKTWVVKATSDELRDMAEDSAKATAALAAKAAKAEKKGVAAFDAARAREERRIARELKAAYALALDESRRELDAIKALGMTAPAGMDAGEWMDLQMRRGELDALIDTLSATMANTGDMARDVVDGRLAQTWRIGAAMEQWRLDNMTGGLATRILGTEYAAMATTGRATYHGKFDLKAWQGVADKRKCRDAIRKAITRGLLTGEHPSVIAERIEGLFTGGTPLSPYKRAVRIAQTETHSIMNQAAFETMKAADAGGLKMKKRWDATLDGSTRKDHRKVDGETVDLDKPFSNGLMKPGDGGPADRINCRCALVNVLDGFAPDAELRRDNVTGKSIPYMTYAEWEAANGVTN